MATTKYIVNNLPDQTINGESILPTYKVYTALLTQSGPFDSPPVATVLENTLGEINYAQGGNGLYSIMSDSLFTPDKTFVLIGNTTTWYDNITYLNYYYGGPSEIILSTFDSIGNKADGLLINTPIEIRVYN